MHEATIQPAPPMPESLPESLAVFIAALCDTLAEHCGADRFFAVVGVPLWGRLHRTAERFQILFTRWREGRLPAARRPVSNPPDAHAQDTYANDTGDHPERAAAAAATRPNIVLPGGRAWLVKLMPHAAFHRLLLQEFLANPDLAAFLAAAPQAGRMLRPLCRMLDVNPLPDILRPPPPNPDAPPRKPRSVTTTPKKMRFWVDRNGNTGPANALPEDRRWVRPFSWFSGPLRTRR